MGLLKLDSVRFALILFVQFVAEIIRNVKFVKQAMEIMNNLSAGIAL